MRENKPKQEDSKEIKLPSQIVKKITEVATTVAIDAYRAEKAKERAAFKDKRFNNTKLLLRKYKELRDYTSNAIYETSQLLDDGMEALFDAFGRDMGNVIKVRSIQNNVTVTKVIMEHIDTMLECYMLRCDKSPKDEVKRRWRVIHSMYLAEDTVTAQDIACTEHISSSMVYTDIDIACEELSTLFFGLDLTSM